VEGARAQEKVAIVYDHAIPKLQFGVQEFENAFKAAGLECVVADPDITPVLG
jgi:ABC-type branched-subunit amino acid transport system substrate-binding protein